MVDLTISITGSNGDTIEFENDGKFILGTGTTGFGIPEAQLRIAPSAGNGGVYRFSKRGVRTLDMPIIVFGDSRDELEANLRRLSKILQDQNGPTRIDANYSDGSNLFIYSHYAGGGETEFGSNANSYFCRWTITMQAPQPFWQNNTTQSFTIGGGGTGRGLLPQFSKLKVASSQGLGTITVTNNGDVETYPTWIVTGPIEEFSVSNGTESFLFDQPIAGGEVITIDTEKGTVVDAAGTNQYGRLATAPKLFPIQPGTTTLDILGTGATSATVIVCNYSPRYEVIH